MLIAVCRIKLGLFATFCIDDAILIQIFLIIKVKILQSINNSAVISNKIKAVWKSIINIINQLQYSKGDRFYTL
jgi:hypothetical protein